MSVRIVPILSFLAVLGFGCFSPGNNPDPRLSAPDRPCSCADTRPLSRPPQDLTPRQGGRVSIRIVREPSSLLSLVDSDPIVAEIINHTVLEPLIRVTDSGRDILPGLAERFEVDEAQFRYTFHLAEAASWHDGRPVTSADVRFVFSKLADPFNPFPQSKIFRNLREIETPDEETVVFTLDKSVPGFLEALARIPILPMHVFGRTPLSLHEASRAPNGSGPFRFVRWVPSQLIELERNPEWRGTPPNLDEIRFTIVPDNRIALDMFAHGDLDIIMDYPTGAAPPDDSAEILSYPLADIETWVFNQRTSLFRDPAVRKALSRLIDRKTIRCAALECQADLVDAPPLSNRADAALFHSEKFDPQGARRLLEDTGWKTDDQGIRRKGESAFRFSLLVPNLGKDIERSAVIIQEDLARIGIDMRITIVSRGAFIGRLTAGRFEAAAMPVHLGGPDTMLSFLHSDGDATVFGDPDREIDGLIDGLRSTRSPEEQAVFRKKIADRIAATVPFAYLFRPYSAMLIRNGIGGVKIFDGALDPVSLFHGKEKP